MGTFTKYLCLSLLLLGWSTPARAEETLRFRGDYFIYCQELNYIYGSGSILLEGGKLAVEGDVLYMDTAGPRGVIYGDVRIRQGEEEKRCDAFFFEAFPLKYTCQSYGDRIERDGDPDTPLFIKKRNPESLKDYALYYEFREFQVHKNGKIKAGNIIPYILGIPSIPLKKFTVNRGEIPEKTMFYFKNIHYSGLDGLSLSSLFRVREPFIRGDFDLKLYERELFKLGGAERGALLSGTSGLFLKKKKILDFSSLLNSGERSFHLSFTHSVDSQVLQYSLSQTVTGREGMPVFLGFSSFLTLKKLKIIAPRLEFTHNLRRSYSYKLSTPLHIWKKIRLSLGVERKVLKDDFRSDTLDFSSSLAFDSSPVSVSSNFYFSRDILQAVDKKNLSLNLRLRPLKFLDDNLSIDLSGFYMFSSLPLGETVTTRSSPGFNAVFQSVGLLLPLGFWVVPSLSVNHIWDNREENFTHFNYRVSLEKKIHNFRYALDFSLSSRYRSRDFWVEGTNTPSLNLHVEFKKGEDYAFNLRFFFNHRIELENINLTGQLKLPLKLKLSSFLLFYVQENRFQAVEIFLEKIFKNKIKIQGGYSLALKRFFIKFLVV